MILPRVRAAAEALTSAGLRVFRDETAIDEGASITREIREGIAASKLLVAFYSSTYPLSGACQEEIVSASSSRKLTCFTVIELEV